MQTPWQGLDGVADLLARWRNADGAVERVQVVADASRVLRDLSDTDGYVLAQGLVEHGAPAAAERVAQHTGSPVPPDELPDIAQSLLAVDAGEIDRFAAELRDPEERRRLLTAAIARYGAGASESASVDPDAGQEEPPPPPGSPPVEKVGTVFPEPPRPPAVVADQRTSAQELTDRLRDAARARERLRELEEYEGGPIDGAGLLAVLRAVPDGWQRRTVLRRFLDAGGAHDLTDAREIVTAFDRRGDRFAVASLLLRAGIADVEVLVATVDARDARRLERRARSS